MPEMPGNAASTAAARRAAGRLRVPAGDLLLLLHAALDAPAEAAARLARSCAALSPQCTGEEARLLPLVWWNLGGAAAPDPAVRALGPAYHESWSRFQGQVAAAERVLAALHAGGVRTLLLKGLPLALTVYARPALRAMADIDVLVAPEDRDAAAALLGRLGYRALRHPGAGELAVMHSVGLVGPDGSTADLHWYALQECCHPGADATLWEHAVPCGVGGVEALAPSPEGLLLTALAHGVRWNGEPPARWAVDSVTLLRRHGSALDWDRLCADAQRRRLAYLLAATLAWLTAELAAPVPGEVLGALAAAGVARSERAELWARQGRPTLARGVVIRWCAHARRAAAGEGERGVRGFLRYLRTAWGVERSAALPLAALRRGADKLQWRSQGGS